jgi:hypothetical protein
MTDVGNIALLPAVASALRGANAPNRHTVQAGGPGAVMWVPRQDFFHDSRTMVAAGTTPFRRISWTGKWVPRFR